MHRPLLRRAALLALLLATWRLREPLAADVLTFDTNGDGVPDLTIPDSDGDGRFEWPTGTTTLLGTLHFSAGNDIAFSGYTTIKADTITIDQGATLSGGIGLHQIVFIATHGDITSQGRHGFGFFSGRIGLTAQLGSIRLLGSFFIGATTVTIQAPRGSITIHADPNAGDFERHIVGHSVSVLARSASGSIVIGNIVLVSSATILDNHASGSGLTVDKGIRLIDGATVGANTTINATGRITLDDASISGDNIKLSTSRATDDVCVGGGSLLRAVSGRINTYGVRGTPHRDETSIVTGPVVGKPFVVGVCP